MSQVEAARAFGVGRASIQTWLKRYKAGGWSALKAEKRGRPRRSRLARDQAATTVRLITDRCPDQPNLRFALWTPEAVRDLLAERFGIHVSVWTIGRYLKRWGLTPRKSLRRAAERDPLAVRRWLDEEYPAIRQRARQENAEIQWADEMGLRSDHQTGTT